MIYEVTITPASASNAAARTFKVELARDPSTGQVVCRLDGEPFALDAAAPGRDLLSLLVAGRSYEVRRDSASSIAANGASAPGNGDSRITVNGRVFSAEVRDPRSLRARRARAGSSEGPRKITAPMPGKVVRILAPQGTQVEAGQGVLVIEAMKMQNEMKSPKKGTVARITAAEGATVNPGDTLAVIE